MTYDVLLEGRPPIRDLQTEREARIKGRTSGVRYRILEKNNNTTKSIRRD